MIQLLKLVAAFFLSGILFLMKAQSRTLEGTIMIPYPHV